MMMLVLLFVFDVDGNKDEDVRQKVSDFLNETEEKKL